VDAVAGFRAACEQNDIEATVAALRWSRELVDGDVRVIIGECRIGPLKLGDAMILELAADGRVRRLSPHLRPWLALTLFAVMLAPNLARHPGVLVRALRPSDHASGGRGRSAPEPVSGFACG